MKNILKIFVLGFIIVGSLFIAKATFAAPLITVTTNVSSLEVVAGTPIVLSWAASLSATSCTIKGNGVLLSSSESTIGERTYTPPITTTYEVSCSGPNAVTGASSKTVNVLLAQNITLSISATPATVAKGESVTINWSTSVASSICNINGDTNIKNNPDSRYYDLWGSKTYTNIQTDTTYTLTCSKTGFATKTTSTSVTVSGTGADVDPATMVVTAYATPDSVVQGGTTTLVWSSTPHADYCSILDLPEAEGAGSKKYYPQVDTTYTVTCYKSGYTTQSVFTSVHVTGIDSTSKADLTISPDRGVLSGTTIDFHPTISNGGGTPIRISFINSYEMQVFTAPKVNGEYVTTYGYDPDGLYYEHSISTSSYTAPMLSSVASNGSVVVNNLPSYTFAPVTSNAYVAYRAKFCTDTNNSISEDSETNNCTEWSCWAPTNVIISGAGCGWGFQCSSSNFGNSGSTSSLPNLKATVPTHTPATVAVGTLLTFSSTINNEGTLATGAGFSNFFQVQKDLSSIVTDLPATLMRALGVGDSSIATATYTLPTSGIYYIKACADKSSDSDTGVIHESNEGDNCSNQTTITNSYTPTVDLTASAPSPRTAFTGFSREFSSTITNNGTGSTGTTSFASLFQTSTSSNGANPTNYVVYPISPLQGGASVEIKKSLSFGTIGKYYVNVCADNYANVTETNEGNNCSGWTEITVTNATDYRPDLINPTVFSPATVVVGTLTEFVIGIVNQGATATLIPFTNELLVSTSSNGANPTPYTFSQTSSVVPGVTSVLFKSMTFPNVGTYYIQVCADSNNNISESDETNNCTPFRPLITVISTTPPPSNSNSSVTSFTTQTGGQNNSGIIEGTLRQGGSGEGVKALQSFLGITADGKFGPITASAVRRWQVSQGLVGDGIFGPKSLAKSGINNQ